MRFEITTLILSWRLVKLELFNQSSTLAHTRHCGGMKKRREKIRVVTENNQKISILNFED